MNPNNIKICKYHGLGNDYLVVEKHAIAPEIQLANLAKTLCTAHYGMGADGLLVNCSNAQKFAVRIFNPDGSEAEKSGNGLRIFARFLYDSGLIDTKPTTVHTLTDRVACQVIDNARQVLVQMGDVFFADKANRPVVENITINGQKLNFYRADVGNPHCVIPVDKALSDSELASVGSQIERQPIFPNRTNVQFIRILDRTTINIQIWERGVGITLASGSSSSAAAAVAFRLGLCDNQIKVIMAGGHLAINISQENQITMQGEVTKVFAGEFYAEALN